MRNLSKAAASSHRQQQVVRCSSDQALFPSIKQDHAYGIVKNCDLQVNMLFIFISYMPYV
jgi:hypothetical protein